MDEPWESPYSSKDQHIGIAIYRGLMKRYPLEAMNLWDRPSPARGVGHIVATLPRGTPVQVLEEREDGWTRVRAETSAGPAGGWLHKTFLSRPG